MNKGKLVLVATPIGNLQDISSRVQETLAAADLIAAEDTRVSRKLLQHLSISKPMTSYFQHNQNTKGEKILVALAEGQMVVLITDAGTPAISDPGYQIAAQAIKAGYELDAIPGPCGLVQALVLSGLSTERFCFEGFLPRTTTERKKYLKTLVAEERTMVFYEAPHRFKSTLKDLKAVFSEERQAAVCRELTKKFQEINRGTLGELTSQWQDREAKGEYTLVVAGAPATKKTQETIDPKDIKQEIKRLIDNGMGSKAAAKEVASRHKISVNQAYRWAIEADS